MLRQFPVIIFAAFSIGIAPCDACVDFKSAITSLASNTSQRILTAAPLIKTKSQLAALKASKAYQQCVDPGLLELWSADCSDLELSMSSLTRSPLPWEWMVYDNYHYEEGEFDAVVESNYCDTNRDTALAKELVKKLGESYERQMHLIQVSEKKYIVNDSESPGVRLEQNIRLYQQLARTVQNVRAVFAVESAVLLKEIPAGCMKCSNQP